MTAEGCTVLGYNFRLPKTHMANRVYKYVLAEQRQKGSHFANLCHFAPGAAFKPGQLLRKIIPIFLEAYHSSNTVDC